MSEIWLAIPILLFLVFGLISYLKKSGKKLVYFSLAVLNLIGALLMVAIIHWDLIDIGKVEKTSSPKTEVNKKDSEIQTDDEKNIEKETPAVEVPPAEEPSVEPVPTPPPLEPSVPQTPPSNPTPTSPTEPSKIIVPENGTINYTVVKGDTLWGIATRAGVTVTKLNQWNNLSSDVIYVGQVLKIYGKNIEPQPPTNPSTPVTPQNTATSVLVSHGILSQKEIALTFDAGSDIAGIGILDVLKKYNVKATFFLTGKWAEKFPSYAKRIVVEGHEIGNHSYSHPDPVKISTSTLVQEITNAEHAIITATGKSPRPYFRFPYGSYNATALKAVGEAGYPLSIQWSLDTIDWQQPTSAVIISRIETGASNGDIILMHIGGINTPEAVDKIIPILSAKGYKLVTLSELLK